MAFKKRIGWEGIIVFLLFDALTFDQHILFFLNYYIDFH